MAIDVVYATATAVLADGITVYKGTHWPKTDPIVRANPRMFSPDPRYGLAFSPGAVPPEMAEPPDEEPGVEQATAGPGEKRGARRPRGSSEIDF